MTPSVFAARNVGICLETLVDPQVLRRPACVDDTALLGRALDAAAAAGFRDAAMWSWRVAGVGIDRYRAMLADSSVRARLVECRIPWLAGPKAVDRQLEAELDIAEALGAKAIAALSSEGSLDLPRAVDGLAALSQGAAARAVEVTVEFVPCHPLGDLATAWNLVRQVGRDNCGLTLDLMHWQYQCGGPDAAALAAIPGRRFHYVQLCDVRAPVPTKEDYPAAALCDRMLPGDGDVDINAVLATLEAKDSDPFLALEVFSAELATLGPESMASRLRDSVDRLFAVESSKG